MNFELKSFEDKINDITEQFMSLLENKDTNDNSVSSVVNSNTTVNTDTTASTNNYSNVYNPITNSVNKENLNIDFSKIVSDYPAQDKYGANDVDTIHYEDDLDKRLEDLYQAKINATPVFDDSPVVKFSDSEVSTNKFNFGFASPINTKDKTNSYNEKGEIKLENNGNEPKLFGGIAKDVNLGNTDVNSSVNPMNTNPITSSANGNLNATTTPSNEFAFALKKEDVKDLDIEENTFFSFATIPQERALTKKRTWKDTLFMDIPWDTKIDIWGSIKSVFNTDIKFTF